MIDTHTHLYVEEFSGEEQAAVQRALDAGVTHLVFPNIDAASVGPMNRLHDLFPDTTSMAIGLHPTEIDGSDLDAQLQFVVDELATGRYIAIGEVGIDLYWDKTYRDAQMQALERQLNLAAGAGLPAIIHCREGLAETLEVIDSLPVVPQMVFHSFGGTADDVDAIRRRGDFMFGINGIVTFKNSRLRDVLPAIGADRILLETDAPYLAPVPHRGRRNESAYLIHTAAHIAATLNLPLPDLAARTTANACTLFPTLP